jgi:succinylglutamic semialdehyde dehydrogenase
MSLWIGGKWLKGDGPALESHSPYDDAVLWQGHEASAQQVELAFVAARDAFYSWMDTEIEQRFAICRKFASQVERDAEAFAKCISREMGKPLWESRTEVAAVKAKVELSIEALLSRRWTTETDLPGTSARAITRYKPFGVVAVLGPFNLPAHLPNGHIVPAILAGNTVVFKPSEQTPMVGEQMLRYWELAGLPAGVINLVQGKREVGTAIVNHPELDGLFFTGSSRGGVAIHRALADHPEKIIALEMGGNNPLLVHQCHDLRAAAYHTILSAYITSGQRCTCARRLILVDSAEADQFLSTLADMMSQIRIDAPDADPPPFISTLISPEMGNQLRKEEQHLIQLGAKPIVQLQQVGGCEAMLSPGLLDATNLDSGKDEELFGPLLQVYRVRDFAAAIAEANNTRYGLAAGLLSDNVTNYDLFRKRIRAGIVNWNRQTTGASGKLPFGGAGLSGNNRPAGFFSADYCSWPVASMESDRVQIPEKTAIGIELD